MLQSLQLTERHLKTSTLSIFFNFTDFAYPLPPGLSPPIQLFLHLVIRFYFVGSSLEIKKMFISLPSNRKTKTNLNC